ncbi:hypothetical protein ACHAPT_003274 [Fusarium lateritium]
MSSDRAPEGGTSSEAYPATDESNTTFTRFGYVYHIFRLECEGVLEPGPPNPPSDIAMAGALLGAKDKDEQYLPQAWKDWAEANKPQADKMREKITKCLAPDGSRFTVRFFSDQCVVCENPTIAVWNSRYHLGMPPRFDNNHHQDMRERFQNSTPFFAWIDRRPPGIHVRMMQVNGPE